MAMGEVCTRCVMDSTDPNITFDAQGHCNHCTTFYDKVLPYWKKLQEPGNLEKTLDVIRAAGKGKPYDCIIGLSGGVDSSYVTVLSKEYGLRPLLFHVDGGWNTPESEANIQHLVEITGFDFDKYTVEWNEMRDLQRAFLQAAVPNQDIPQDHLFFAVLFHLAQKMSIRYWLSGSNYASESILPSAWGFCAMDSRHLLAIHKQFGQIALKTFPLLSPWEYCRYYLGLGPASITRIDPLNMVDYQVPAAKKMLMAHYGWQDYGRKHGESVFTRFFQNYYLPAKFGYDKRKAHYSSLICSGQMTREEALERLAEPLYEPAQLDADLAQISEKLGYSPEEFSDILERPVNKHSNYADNTRLFALASQLRRVQTPLGLLVRGELGTFTRKLWKKIVDRNAQ